MSDTPNQNWLVVRDEWVKARTDAELLALASQIAKGALTDENEGDRTERREALEWLHSRGERGREWGIIGAASIQLGMRA